MMMFSRPLWTWYILSTFSCVLNLLVVVEGGLYNATDHVILLDNKNFNENVLGSASAWVVQFYNTWCGHCQHFAPTFKQFAADIQDWDHTIKVGVIDCSEEGNVGTCREYDVMGYPIVRLFSSNSSKSDVGKDFHKRSLEEMRHETVDFIVDQEKANNGSKSWANLQLFIGVVSDVWNEVPAHVEHVVLIAVKEPTHVDREIVLDLHKYSETMFVRLIQSGTEDSNMFNFGADHSVFGMVRGNTHPKLMTKITTRNETVSVVITKIGIVHNVKVDGIEIGEKLFTGDQISRDRLNYDDLPDTAYSTFNSVNQVFLVDIENTLAYALRREVSQRKFITGEAMRSLRDFLDAVVKYLPMRREVHTFMTELHDYVETQGKEISGEDLADKLKSLEEPGSVLPQQQAWKGCTGSQSKYRGYPCGLWATFHTMTVQAAERRKMIADFDPKDILRVVHGYVKHFFTCSHCSLHFQQMYIENKAQTSVSKADDAILWLWKAHNIVNKRLNGDITEDPKHPKVQFPTQMSCPDCWNEEGFVEQQVLMYLHQIYGEKALSHSGLQPIEMTHSNRQAKVHDTLNKHRNQHIFPSPSDDELDMAAPGWFFAKMDVSVCVGLYGTSALVLLFIYCMVLLRRRMQRRQFLDAYKQP